MSYKFKTDYNQALVDLADVDPQPKSPGIDEGQRKTLGDGTEVIDGKVITKWQFTALTAAQYAALLTAFDLVSNVSRKITIYTTINKDRSFVRYNAIIIRPDAKEAYDTGFLHDIEFKLVKLEAL